MILFDLCFITCLNKCKSYNLMFRRFPCGLCHQMCISRASKHDKPTKQVLGLRTVCMVDRAEHFAALLASVSRFDAEARESDVEHNPKARGAAVIEHMCALTNTDMCRLFERPDLEAKTLIDVMLPRKFYSSMKTSHKFRQEIEVCLGAWRRLFEAIPAFSFTAKVRLMHTLRSRKFHKMFIDMIIQLFECTLGPQLTQLKNVCDTAYPDGGLASLVFESYDPSGERLVRILSDASRYSYTAVAMAMPASARVDVPQVVVAAPVSGNVSPSLVAPMVATSASPSFYPASASFPQTGGLATAPASWLAAIVPEIDYQLSPMQARSPSSGSSSGSSLINSGKRIQELFSDCPESPDFLSTPQVALPADAALPVTPAVVVPPAVPRVIGSSTSTSSSSSSFAASPSSGASSGAASAPPPQHTPLHRSSSSESDTIRSGQGLPVHGTSSQSRPVVPPPVPTVRGRDILRTSSKSSLLSGSTPVAAPAEAAPSASNAAVHRSHESPRLHPAIPSSHSQQPAVRHDAELGAGMALGQYTDSAASTPLQSPFLASVRDNGTAAAHQGLPVSPVVTTARPAPSASTSGSTDIGRGNSYAHTTPVLATAASPFVDPLSSILPGASPFPAQLSPAASPQLSPMGAPRPVKLFSDIDDTIFPNFHDVSYPSGVVYPGVREFYSAVMAGRRDLGQPQGQLVFVTAR